jgi:hypothetical protein
LALSTLAEIFFAATAFISALPHAGRSVNSSTARGCVSRSSFA